MNRQDRAAKSVALERTHVHDVYDHIAPHFVDTRFKAWPKVKQFLKELEPGSLIGDIGCGHGKYLGINSTLLKLGSDRCEKLVEIAANKGHEVMVCDNLHLPYRDNIFDAVISIGVIHHLVTGERRAQAVKELARVLRPGGKLLIYVWALEQNHRRFEGQDVLVPWHMPSKCLKQKEKRSRSEREFSSTSSLSEDDASWDSVDLPSAPSRAPSASSNHSSLQDIRKPSLLQNGRLKNGKYPPDVPSSDDDPDGKSENVYKGDHSTSYLDLASESPGLPSAKSASVKKSRSKPHFYIGRATTEVELLKPNVTTEKSEMDFLRGENDPRQDSVPYNLSAEMNGVGDDKVAERKTSDLAAWAKFNILNFLGSVSSKISPPHHENLTNKDLAYRKLVNDIMTHEAEMTRRQRGKLEHSESAPEADLVFAVREFPQSSQLHLRKGSSLNLPDSESNTSLSSMDSGNFRNSSLTKQRNVAYSSTEDSSDSESESPQRKFHQKVKGHKSGSSKFNKKSISGNHKTATLNTPSKAAPLSKSCQPGFTEASHGNASSHNHQVAPPASEDSRTGSQNSTSHDSSCRKQKPSGEIPHNGQNLGSRENCKNQESSPQDANVVENRKDSIEERVRKLKMDLKHSNHSKRTFGSPTQAMHILQMLQDFENTVGMRYKDWPKQSGEGEDDENGKVPDRCKNGTCTTTATYQDDVFGAENSSRSEESHHSDGKTDQEQAKNGHDTRICNGNEQENSEKNDDPLVDRSTTYQRYYHVFREGELDEMIEKKIPSLHIIKSYYDHANWCVVAEKC